MSIELEDRIRRALAFARARGITGATPRILAELRSHANGLASVEPAQAEVLVALVDEVDAKGRASGETLATRVPIVAVLDDEGTLTACNDAATLDGVVAVVCRRGLLELGERGFLLLEVEDGVSARETQQEYGVPMLADERLAPFE